eukprot:COSAG05_NODE_61_length_23137_cov_22.080693_14_plen_96_part_00
MLACADNSIALADAWATLLRRFFSFFSGGGPAGSSSIGLDQSLDADPDAMVVALGEFVKDGRRSKTDFMHGVICPVLLHNLLVRHRPGEFRCEFR